MAAYILFIRESEVRDPAEMALYRGGHRPALVENFQMKALAAYGAMETLEGAPADGLVILSFPDVETARAWYYSPEYQEAAIHRQKAADYRGFLIEGL